MAGDDAFAFGDFGSFDFDIDMDGFDFSQAEESSQTAIYTRPVVKRPKTVCYDRAEDFARDIVLDNNLETFAYVSGDFVFGDFMEALVDLGKLSARRMCVQTLSLNDENIDSIRNIVEWEQVERLDVVLSDYWYAHERKKGGLVGYLFDEWDLPGLELHVAFCRNHAKVWTVETRSGNALTVQGSANLRSSDNIEQLHISPDKGLHDFCAGYIRGLVEEYDVVRQERRGHGKRQR